MTQEQTQDFDERDLAIEQAMRNIDYSGRNTEPTIENSVNGQATHPDHFNNCSKKELSGRKLNEATLQDTSGGSKKDDVAGQSKDNAHQVLPAQTFDDINQNYEEYLLRQRPYCQVGTCMGASVRIVRLGLPDQFAVCEAHEIGPLPQDI